MRVRWRGLELPSQVVCERETLSPTFGRFVIEPFERGFGVTIGNSLRRVLLSAIEGSAITQVKIHGSQHEFTTLPGVVEDVTDILLNLKAVVVKKHSDDKMRVMRIEKKQRGLVTAGDIETDESVEIINKDHVIATLTEDVSFEVEMVVENGRGYVPATEHSNNIEVGIIPIDAVFTPIPLVRYSIEETRVGQKTNYDRLILEIHTDGSIDPQMALVEAAKIMRKHLNPFVQYQELGRMVHAQGPATRSDEHAQIEAKLNMPLSELHLSVRAMNCLESENIHTVRDLVQHTEDQLLEVRNFGETTLREVLEKLSTLGVRLGMRLPQTSGV